MDQEMSVHPALLNLSWLVGRWQGSGHGCYPTIKPFDYHETITFGHCGKPFLTYRSRTVHAVEKFPMHAEDGFWKVKPGTDQLAVTIAENIGVAELLEGSISGDGSRVSLLSTSVNGPSFGKEPHILKVQRVYEKLSENELKLTMHMATTTTPDLTLHLVSQLERVDSA